MTRLEYLELFFGKSFTGKTARMLHEVWKQPRLVIADPKCAQLVELDGFDHLWPEYRPGKGGGWTGSDNPADYFRGRGRRDKFRAIVHVRAHFTQQLESLCLLARAVGNLTLCVDELGLFVPAGGNCLPPSITSAMISGRHEGLIFAGTAQIPNRVHDMVRSNAARIRWFRIDEKNSLGLARSYMPAEWVASLPSLPDYVCIETSDRTCAFRDESMVGKIDLIP